MSEDQGLHLKTKWGELKGKQVAELIAVFSLVVVVLLAYVLYEHKQETREDRQDITRAIRGFAAEQRMMTCILSTPEDRREAEMINPNSWCNRQSRQQ